MEQQTTGNYNLKIFDFAVDSTQSFVNGVAGLQDSNMHKVAKGLANKVQLNGVGGESNFNFIPNKVVEEGLALDNIIDTTKEFDITYNFKAIKNAPASICFMKNGGVNVSSGGNIRFYYNNGATNIYTTTPAIFTNGKLYCIRFYKKGNTLCLDIEGKTYTSELVGYTGGIQATSIGDTFVETIYLLCYNRQLAPAEIQHNISALNNPKSISSLETTPSDGNKVKHLFHSDSQVVSMRDERTLNEFANEVLDWEEKTADASGKIEVNNCKRAWLRNFSIEGQTIKNYIDMKRDITFVKSSNTYANWSHVLEIGKRYKIIIFVKELTSEGACNLRFAIKGSAFYQLANIKMGTNIIDLELTAGTANFSYMDWLNISDTNNIVFDMVIVDVGYEKFVTSYIPFGLSSTVAQISNNGMKYRFYANEEDKSNNKVIELSKVGDVADTLMLNDDGSGKWVDSSHKVRLLSAHSWEKATTDGNITRFYTLDTTNGKLPIKKNGHINIKCNILPTSINGTVFEVGISGYDSDGRIYIKLLNTVTDTIEKLNTYLDTNEVTVEYELANPTTIPIPKELIPVVATNKTNICTVDSAVSPSSFKATFPIDKVALMEARLAALEAKTNTMAVNVPYVEETLENSKNKIEEVMLCTK